MKTGFLYFVKFYASFQNTIKARKITLRIRNSLFWIFFFSSSSWKTFLHRSQWLSSILCHPKEHKRGDFFVFIFNEADCNFIMQTPWGNVDSILGKKINKSNKLTFCKNTYSNITINLVLETIMNIAEKRDYKIVIIFALIVVFQLITSLFLEKLLLSLTISYMFLWYCFVKMNKQIHFVVGMIIFMLLWLISFEETIRTEACVSLLVSFFLFITSLFNTNNSGWKKYIPLVGALIVLGNVLWFTHVMGKLG